MYQSLPPNSIWILKWGQNDTLSYNYWTRRLQEQIRTTSFLWRYKDHRWRKLLSQTLFPSDGKLMTQFIRRYENKKDKADNRVIPVRFQLRIHFTQRNWLFLTSSSCTHRCLAQLSAANRTGDHQHDHRPFQPTQPSDCRSKISTQDSRQKAEIGRIVHSATLPKSTPETKTVIGKTSSWARNNLKEDIN